MSLLSKEKRYTSVLAKLTYQFSKNTDWVNVDEPHFRVPLPHRHSIVVSLETNPFALLTQFYSCSQWTMHSKPDKFMNATPNTFHCVHQ